MHRMVPRPIVLSLAVLMLGTIVAVTLSEIFPTLPAPDRAATARLLPGEAPEPRAVTLRGRRSSLAEEPVDQPAGGFRVRLGDDLTSWRTIPDAAGVHADSGCAHAAGEVRR